MKEKYRNREMVRERERGGGGRASELEEEREREGGGREGERE